MEKAEYDAGDQAGGQAEPGSQDGAFLQEHGNRGRGKSPHHHDALEGYVHYA